MANRFSSVSTSTFKPLSLDEIMAVPLAKQAQHDEATLALDEFSKMEANSLDVDKDYISGQIGAFQGESDAISSSLLDSGVNRGLVNKIKALRNRKNKEFSLQGKTGQASAAYNQFKANELAINKRKDLTAAQKEAGLRKAKNDYLGVAQGGQYQDYTGTSHVDIMKKGRDIASQMTPEEKASIIGMTYDATTGYYSDGNYMTKTLTPEHIQQVVYQGLKGDRLVTDYANELEGLGIEGSADDMLRDAAVNAGNIYQVSVNKEDASYRAPSKNKDSSAGLIDVRSQPWNSMYLKNLGAAFTTKYGLDEENFPVDLFDSETGNVLNYTADQTQAAKDRKAELDATEKQYRKDLAKWNSDPQALATSLAIANKATDIKYGRIAEDADKAAELKTILNDIRGDNEVLATVPDAKIYELFNAAKKKSVSSFGQAFRPDNPKNTYWDLMDNLMGKGDKLGVIEKKDIVTSSGERLSFGNYAEAEEFEGFLGNKYDKAEISQAIRDTGSSLGYAPGFVDMPGADIIQFQTPDGELHTFYSAPDVKQKNAFKSVGKMNQAIIDGKPYTHETRTSASTGKRVEEHIITEFNPKSGKYEAAVIRSKVKLPEEELKKLVFEDGADDGLPGVLVAIDNNGNSFYRLNYDQEVQKSKDLVSKYYDKTPNQGQVLGKSQKNK